MKRLMVPVLLVLFMFVSFSAQAESEYSQSRCEKIFNAVLECKKDVQYNKNECIIKYQSRIMDCYQAHVENDVPSPSSSIFAMNSQSSSNCHEPSDQVKICLFMKKHLDPFVPDGCEDMINKYRVSCL